MVESRLPVSTARRCGGLTLSQDSPGGWILGSCRSKNMQTDAFCPSARAMLDRCWVGNGLWSSFPALGSSSTGCRDCPPAALVCSSSTVKQRNISSSHVPASPGHHSLLPLDALG